MNGVIWESKWASAARIKLEWTRGAGCASGEGSVDEATDRFYWKHWLENFPLCCKLLLCWLEKMFHWNSIVLLEIWSEKFHHALWLGLIPSVLHPWEASNSQRERLSVYYFQQSTWTPYSPHCFTSTVNAKPRVWKSVKPLQTRRDWVLDLSLTLSITLLTQYHFFRRLFARFVT